VIDVTGPELATELAQILLSKASVLIDVATRLGCACSGAVVNVPPEAARAAVATLEPPRASSPIVDDRVPVSIELPLPAVARDPIDLVPSVASRRSSGASRPAPPPEPPPAEPPADAAPSGRRRSPTHGVTVRQHSGSIPTTRSGEGRTLPRAYVARRGQRAPGGGRQTPPRGESSQLDASGRGDRVGNGGAPRPVTRGAGRGMRDESEDRAMIRAPSGELPVRSKEPALAAVGAAPDRAGDPHGEPLTSADEMAVAADRGVWEPAPAADVRPTATAEPRGPSPISEVGPSRAATFRASTAKLARLAASTAHQRRAIIAALLGVALLSASVGVLAGRWLAARTAVGAGR
jgi:hypothetical protein